MRRIQSEGISRTLQRLGELSSMATDHIDLNQTFRTTARMDGVPESVLRSNNDVLRLRREYEEAAAEAQAQALAQQEGSAGNPGSALSKFFPTMPNDEERTTTRRPRQRRTPEAPARLLHTGGKAHLARSPSKA